MRGIMARKVLRKGYDWGRYQITFVFTKRKDGFRFELCGRKMYAFVMRYELLTMQGNES